MISEGESKMVIIWLQICAQKENTNRWGDSLYISILLQVTPDEEVIKR